MTAKPYNRITVKTMEYDYDSILKGVDSNVINRTDFYKQGSTLPDQTVAMRERDYTVGGDDCIVAGMVAMFFVLATILYRSRMTALYRLKDFFTTKRLYSEEHVNGNSSEAGNVFLLITISALSLSLIFFDNMADLYRFNPALDVPYWMLAACFVCCMFIIYAKAAIYGVVNWVFFDSESCKKWMAGYFLMTSLTAFLTYPIALVDVFFANSHQIVTASAILIGFTYELLLLYKLFTNFKTKKYGHLLIFLYFCSVELMPALVVWNVLGRITDSFIVKNLLY